MERLCPFVESVITNLLGSTALDIDLAVPTTGEMVTQVSRPPPPRFLFFFPVYNRA